MPNDSWTRTFDSSPPSRSCSPIKLLRNVLEHSWPHIEVGCKSWLSFYCWHLRGLYMNSTFHPPWNGRKIRTKPNEIWNGFGLYSNGCPLTFQLMSLGQSTIHLAKQSSLQWPRLKVEFRRQRTFQSNAIRW